MVATNCEIQRRVIQLELDELTQYGVSNRMMARTGQKVKGFRLGSVIHAKQQSRILLQHFDNYLKENS